MKELKQAVSQELQEHILPFWLKLIDREHGGFYGLVDFELQVHPEADKGAIAHCRSLWTFSSAYRVTGNERYLEAARHAFDFISNHMIDTELGGLYWMTDHKGAPQDTRKHVYAHAFAIYAFSEYYRAAGAEEALKLAKSFYRLIEEKGFNSHNKAYREEFNREWVETSNEKLSENGVIADITMNTHLHVLEAYTNLFRVWPDEDVRNKLTDLTYRVYDKVYDKEGTYLKVFFDKQWNSLLDMISFGHDIEASWLLDEAIKVLGLKDEKLDRMVIDIAYNIGRNAIDQDGSLINEREGGHTDRTRIWWVQAEGIVGFVNAYERTQDEWFLQLAGNLWKYIKSHIVDPREGGEWFWAVAPDGYPSTQPIVEPWKCNYHNGRFCMEIMERVND